MMNKVLPIIILIAYLVVKFCFTQQLDSLGPYSAYIFEVIFVLAVGFYYRKRINIYCDYLEELKLGFFPALIAGGVAFQLAKPLGIVIPFDLKSGETILFLLLIGPILEEFIFRMALWESIVDISKKQTVALVATTLLFSYGHFHAYWFVPEQIFPFIYYQSIYVIPLAFYCGYRMMKTNSIVSPIAVHMGFNLGFFLSSL